MTSSHDTIDWLEALQLQAQNLSERWTLWKQLFGEEDDDRLDLLRDSANELFLHVESTFRDSVLSLLCCLNDQPETGRNTNLCLKAAVEEIGYAADVRAERWQKAAIRTLDRVMPDIKKFRDKVLAHHDREQSLSRSGLPLPAYRSVDRAVYCTVGLINSLDRWSRGAVSTYSMRGDGDSLIQHLRAAREC